MYYICMYVKLSESVFIVCVFIYIYICAYIIHILLYIYIDICQIQWKKKEATDLWVGLLWRGLRQGNLGTTCSAHLEREDNVPTNSWISDCDSEKHWNILCLDFQLGGYHGSLWLGPLRYYNIHMICMTSPTSQVWKITNSVLSGFKFSLCHMIAVWF